MNSTLPTVDIGDLGALLDSFELSLRAEGKANTTIVNYMYAARRLYAFLAESGMPTSVSAIRREHVEAFLVHLGKQLQPSSVAVRYRALRALFKWLEEEGEIAPDSSPMRHLREPKFEPPRVEIVPDEHLRKLFDIAKNGQRGGVKPSRFQSVRDTSILRLLVSTGARVGEISAIKLDDVHLADGCVLVNGKTGTRLLWLSNKARRDLDRYLRVRPAHPDANLPWLFIGRGRLGVAGIQQRLATLCERAGIPRIHPHQLRHTAAHRWLSSGGSETDAMTNFGWKTADMIQQRYGASMREQRARDAFQRMQPGDDL